MSVINTQKSDFGMIDFLIKRMTFAGQDFLRLLIHKFGEVCAFQVS